jgi:hypothetical protein
MSSSTRARRKEKDRSRHTGKNPDDKMHSKSLPSIVPDSEEDFAGLRMETLGKEKDKSRQSEKQYDYDDDLYSDSTPRVALLLEEDFAELRMETSGKEKEKWEDWSNWEWAPEYNCHSRDRENKLGEWQYEYAQFLEDGGNQTNVR